MKATAAGATQERTECSRSRTARLGPQGGVARSLASDPGAEALPGPDGTHLAGRDRGWWPVGRAVRGSAIAGKAIAGKASLNDLRARVRAEGGGSRVDVRSKSRVGRSDVGANAARIRRFLARLG